MHRDRSALGGPKDELVNEGVVQEVDIATGKTLWTLGGKHSDFRLGPGMGFAWQHDIRAHGDRVYSLFDNHASGPGEAKQSRALVFRLDPEAMTATLLRSYVHTPPLLSTSQGDIQLLPNGDVIGASTPASVGK